jgi:serine/threonine-protein kinase
VGVAHALEYAHERGIVHRNIKPGHILINDSLSVIKLGDLTLAKAMDGCGERITRPGQIVGNPCYVAPELLSGDNRADGRADIYSLGLTLYAILTGRHPFGGLSAVEMFRDKQAGRLDPPSRIQLGIPPLLEGVVMRMTAPNPDDRYASATELLRELDRVRKYSGMTV